ncbi:putative UPF0481 protein At3g02645 [Rutidosis leptorrhynchoides]|uniref:putative UPF0481 protein At3g02645 n=1 Tax=Rutidosis leptorrhynchoides TaxID=125765 RepID=UPI003A99559C
MSTLTKNFSSTFKEQRWVDQISRKFIREVAISISDENPICIFNVPKTITVFKPKAYVPQVIALGPYHHMDPLLYHMERYKISCAKWLFNQTRHFRHENNKFQELLIDKLKKLDPLVRGCYHNYLDFDDDTLFWIFAIDGLFLLNLLHEYFVDREGKKLARDAILSRDLLLLENQIPFVVLSEISSQLNTDEIELLHKMEHYCHENSPLQLSSISSDSCYETSHLHLLDLMYHLIVNNGSSETERSSQYEYQIESASEEIRIDEEDINSARDNIGEITDLAMNFGMGKKILKPLQVIQDIPWDRLLTILGIKLAIDDPKNYEGPLVKEIKIPSVSLLHYYAGIMFKSTNDGLRGLKFVEEEAVLYLPIITLDVNSEVVLRNLVAYETSMNYSCSSYSLSQFVDLISGIIDDAEDAKLLKQNGIIKGDLTNDQIADLFNGMNKVNHYGNKTAMMINEYYKKRPVVKTFKFMKKKLLSLWKVVTQLLTVLVLLLLILYSFCEFYGCSRLLGDGN